MCVSERGNQEKKDCMCEENSLGKIGERGRVKERRPGVGRHSGFSYLTCQSEIVCVCAGLQRPLQHEHQWQSGGRFNGD